MAGAEKRRFNRTEKLARTDPEVASPTHFPKRGHR
jgi:hypothetical protein